MRGAIIGDIAGSRFEFNIHRSKDFDLFAEGCFATDNSIMTLAIAKAILACEAIGTGSASKLSTLCGKSGKSTQTVVSAENRICKLNDYRQGCAVDRPGAAAS